MVERVTSLPPRFSDERDLLQYLPSPESYEACLHKGLRGLIQRVGTQLMSYATRDAVAEYNQTKDMIAQAALEAQLFHIDKFIETFVMEEDQRERALIAEGDRLATQSRLQALFPWEKDMQGQHF